MSGYGMESQPKLGAELQRLGFEPIAPYQFYRNIFGNNLLDQERDSEELKALKEHCKSRVGGYVGILVYLIQKDKKGTRLDALFAQPPCGYNFGRLLFAKPP